MHLYSFLYPNITECVNFSISDSETINITSVFGYYVIPSLSVFGTLVNFLVVLSTGRLNLENKVYKYIQIRSFNDMLICILSIGFQDAACNNCEHFRYNHLNLQVYRLYFFLIQTKVLYMASNICNIGIAYHRYCFINDIQNFLSRINIHIFYAFAIATSMLLNFPDYFAYKITFINEDLYSLERTEFGQSLFFKYFYVIRIVVHNFISCILFFVFYICIVYKFIVFRYRSDHLEKYPTIYLINQVICFLISRVFNSIDASLEDFLFIENHAANIISRTVFSGFNILYFTLWPLIFLLIDKNVAESLKNMIKDSLSVKN
jgi:hypothetical protein